MNNQDALRTLSTIATQANKLAGQIREIDLSADNPDIFEPDELQLIALSASFVATKIDKVLARNR